MRVVVIIPSRYGSTRFDGKPLAKIAGKPMIQWVYERAMAADSVENVHVATDDERIRRAVEGFGGQVIMTAAKCRSGTDRVAEAVMLEGTSFHMGIRILRRYCAWKRKNPPDIFTEYAPTNISASDERRRAWRALKSQSWEVNTYRLWWG